MEDISSPSLSHPPTEVRHKQAETVMAPPCAAAAAGRRLAAALALLALSAAAQSLQCDNVLCFAGPINDGVVLQRAPAHAAVLGSVPPASPANAPMTLTFAGTDGAGAAYNKTFAFAAMADSTWKLVLPDAFEQGGNFTIIVQCPTCAGGVTSIWRTNATFGDVWVCSGQSRYSRSGGQSGALARPALALSKRAP